MTGTMTIDSRLLAIDPVGCGCTECIIGEYRPADQATDDEIQALFLGLLSDHTSEHWHIVQDAENGGYDVSGPTGRSVHVETVVLPIPVEYFQLTANHDAHRAIALGAPFLD